MPRHHRRILFEYDDDHGACDPWAGCPSPPSPPPYTFPPTPTPSPSPSPSDWSFLITPPVPGCAPAPSPDRQPAAGRRNQWATNTYPPLPVPAPTGGGDGHHRRFVTNVLIAAAALAFLSLILFGVSVAVRRRQVRRRRRQALLAPAPAATTNDPEGGGGGGGGVVHHVWYIRTVGLDPAAIESIAATRYRAGAPGLLGKADCSVCLGEFADGELLRLLPKCGHAFHVPCIDTWLRAHVNCPLCRSDVIDTAATPAAIGVEADPVTDPVANANAAAEQLAAASDPTLEQEDEDNDQEASHVAEDQRDHQPSSPEPLPLPLPQPPCPLARNMRRAASMDAAMVSAAADVAALDRLPEAAPEGEQSDREKDLSTETPAPAAGPPRFFFSRHCRARSSVLPL
ncbi:RING-H2 finger protein ATL52-like [Lolium rigidum]|uniref:RING-H2 finger protein ATL52-like n=1 Tax=Lolium rigidum TaxID=89674 RepID=UPI001F5CEE98|nr:RING-H2 finger protein ATL52-like [Lolium rigidum]